MAQSPDDVDLRILALLARDGRMSHASIASAVGLSGPAVYERIRKLERQGVIRGYRAVLDAEQLGVPVLAFVEVDLDPRVPAGGLISELQGQEAVLEVHQVFGGDGLVLKVSAATCPALWAWVQRLRGTRGVAATRTRLVAATAFERGPAVPAATGERLPRRRSRGG